MVKFSKLSGGGGWRSAFEILKIDFGASSFCVVRDGQRGGKNAESEFIGSAEDCGLDHTLQFWNKDVDDCRGERVLHHNSGTYD